MGCNASRPGQRPTIVMVETKNIDFDDYILLHRAQSGQHRNQTTNPTRADDESTEPPPRPPKLSRKKLIPDVGIFQKIDEYALKVPKSAEISVKTLAKYLIKPTKNDLEKIRVFYRWITNNIQYDTDSLFKGIKKPVDADSTLRLKTSVCAGYTNLFAELCRYCDIRCRCLHGFAKGFGYNPEKSISYTDEINHSWNVVYLYDDWRFVECTWGAGYCDENKKFVWSYNDFYFLPDPEHFVSSHFPYLGGNLDFSLPWQLVYTPVDLHTFNRSIKPRPRAYEWDVQFISHKHACFEIRGTVEILLKGSGSPLINIGAHLMEKDGTVLKQYSYVQKMEEFNTFQAVFKPPEAKSYILKILGTDDPDDDEIHSLIEYTVKCVKIADDLSPYPIQFGSWGPIHNYFGYGFAYDIPSGPFISDNGEFQLTLNITREIDAVARLICAENNFGKVDVENNAILETNPKQLLVQARMPKTGYYKLRISCKSKNTDAYKQVINYLIHCKSPLSPCPAFPKILKAARDYHCRLLEPRSLELPAHTDVCIKLTSPVLVKVIIKRQRIKQSQDGIWEGTVTTPGHREGFILSGSDSEESFKGLYEFIIVN